MSTGFYRQLQITRRLRDKVKPDRIISPSANTMPLLLLLDLGFTIAAGLHYAIINGSDITHRDSVAQKPQLCSSEQSKRLLSELHILDKHATKIRAVPSS